MDEVSRKIFGEGAPPAPTRFAPPERATRTEVEASIEALGTQPAVQELLEAIEARVLILNRQRQILFGNGALLEDLGRQDARELLGYRPGEAFGCVHAWDGAAGCGTSEACATCGWAIAILASQENERPEERECLMTVQRRGSTECLELMVKASPMRVGGETFTVLSLRDLRDQKRREALEQVFFHDLLNTVAGIDGWARAIVRGSRSEKAAGRIAFLTEELKREILAQRALLDAERGTLELSLAPVAPSAVLDVVSKMLSGNAIVRGKELLVTCEAHEPLVTDGSLLIRVVANMLKNAYEATQEGGTVRLGARPAGGGCELYVWNAGEIPARVASQIFQRSFTTKTGRGRGLGTFSMKLFGERYLGGTVAFETSADAGTTFSIRLK
ncbi:MAG: histidine kinase [Deltaproteobacteria bacterium]|nr:histidine kinase [Deltaproteobacteria bacterium]